MGNNLRILDKIFVKSLKDELIFTSYFPGAQRYISLTFDQTQIPRV